MWRYLRAVGLGALGCLAWVSTAQAHVAWVTERDSVFEPGQQVTLTWRVTIPHDTVAFELEFYLDPDADPVGITTVAPDVTSFDWLVPEVTCDTCSLRVIQDNTGADYDATIPIRIGSAGTAGAPGAGGTVALDGTMTTTGVSATVSGAGGNGAGGNGVGPTTTDTATSASVTTASVTSGGDEGATTVAAGTTGMTDASTSSDPAVAQSQSDDGSCSLAGAAGGAPPGGVRSKYLWGLLGLLGVEVSRQRRAARRATRA